MLEVLGEILVLRLGTQHDSQCLRYVLLCGALTHLRRCAAQVFKLSSCKCFQSVLLMQQREEGFSHLNLAPFVKQGKDRPTSDETKAHVTAVSLYHGVCFVYGMCWPKVNLAKKRVSCASALLEVGNFFCDLQWLPFHS